MMKMMIDDVVHFTFPRGLCDEFLSSVGAKMILSVLMICVLLVHVLFVIFLFLGGSGRRGGGGGGKGIGRGRKERKKCAKVTSENTFAYTQTHTGTNHEDTGKF